ncbi:ABC transporter substrate-binding protein [Spirochaetota bacterium]|nr:ABC transporter substrate-binding protein [Spirochaetota bacterium]
MNNQYKNQSERQSQLKMINRLSKISILPAFAKLQNWGSIAFVIAITMLMLSSCGKSDVLKIAVEGAYPPFSQTEADGSVTGFDIDIANALCSEMNVKCELVTQEWDGMIPSLIAKKYDAIVASMSITEERLEKVNFTDKYYASTASFAGTRGAPQLTGDVSDNKSVLKGKRIGVQQATVSDAYITDNYSDVATINRYSKQDEIYLDLQAGRIDYVFSDTVPLVDGFLKTPAGADYELLSPGYADEQWFGRGIGIAIRKGEEDLVAKFNTAIATIRDSGAYDEIQQKYFEFDIYGD